LNFCAVVIIGLLSVGWLKIQKGRLPLRQTALSTG